MLGIVGRSSRPGSVTSEVSQSRAASEAGSIDRRADGSNSDQRHGGSRRHSIASSIQDKDEDLAGPMDPDLQVFRSTNELIERLANRGDTGWRTGQGRSDHVTVADIEGSLEEMKEEKDTEALGHDAKKVYEHLARNTIIPPQPDKKAAQKLNAARMCEIENRLSQDPSLRTDANEFVVDQQCAAVVKRGLTRTYNKIKKNDHNLSQHSISLLEERIQTLKGP